MYFGNIGERIRTLRKNEKLTQKELATRINMSESIIQKYEANKISDIPINTLETIAKALKTTVSYLIGQDEFEEDLSKMNGFKRLMNGINC